MLSIILDNLGIVSKLKENCGGMTGRMRDRLGGCPKDRGCETDAAWARRGKSGAEL